MIFSYPGAAERMRDPGTPERTRDPGTPERTRDPGTPESRAKLASLSRFTGLA